MRRQTIISRPVVWIRVGDLEPAENHLFLVDTGSDLSLLPINLADPLGITLRPEARETTRGIGREPVQIWHATINLELLTPGGGPRWSARVGFHAGYQSLLGHAGFLDHFTARFNGRAKTLTLTPNGTAPTPL